MSAEATIFIAGESVLTVLLVAWLMTPSGRGGFRRLLKEMRRLYIITPLRLITGRRAPDYLRIARLERGLYGAPPGYISAVDRRRVGPETVRALGLKS